MLNLTTIVHGLESANAENGLWFQIVSSKVISYLHFFSLLVKEPQLCITKMYVVCNQVFNKHNSWAVKPNSAILRCIRLSC